MKNKNWLTAEKNLSNEKKTARSFISVSSRKRRLFLFDTKRYQTFLLRINIIYFYSLCKCNIFLNE